MALIKCSECGKEISDKAVSCPHCGAPVGTSKASIKPQKKKGGKLKYILIIIFIVLAFSIFGGDKEQKADNEATSSQIVETPGQKEIIDVFEKIVGEKKPTEKETFDLVQKAANAGSIDGEAMLGSLYIFGEGTKQDVTKGYEMLKKTVDAGSDYGLSQMARLYLNGATELGIKKDPPKAIALLNKAVENDRGFFGSLNLADCYKRGAGVSKDKTKELELLKLAQKRAKEMGATKWASGLDAKIFDLENAPDITISPEEYQGTYEANEVAADKQFRNKTIRMTGAVKEITKGPLGGIDLYLRAGGSFMGVFCKIDSHYEDYVASLRKGQVVTIQGKGGGFTVTSAVLNDCWFPGKKAAPPKSKLKQLSDGI
ncbi:MAG: zinc-ribbon domain-containing protein [Oscillospiraceae bacterium]